VLLFIAEADDDEPLLMEGAEPKPMVVELDPDDNVELDDPKPIVVVDPPPAANSPPLLPLRPKLSFCTYIITSDNVNTDRAQTITDITQIRPYDSPLFHP
jgi:hypothetical protein